MRIRTLAAAFALGATLAGLRSYAHGNETPPLEEEVSLCAALQRATPGERIAVVVTGMIVVGHEQQIFFDPRQRQCSGDVQPSTWIELGELRAKTPNLNLLLARGGRALATVRGELYGPPPLSPDNPALSPGAAYANRIFGRRYGHLDRFRTKLVVHEIVGQSAVPADDSPSPVIDREPVNGESAIVSASLPLYPELARRAGISGDVAVRVVVKGGQVVTAEVVSGDRMLGGSTVNSVKGWHFAPDVDVEFLTLFAYRLEHRQFGASTEPRQELALPHFALITAPSYDW